VRRGFDGERPRVREISVAVRAVDRMTRHVIARATGRASRTAAEALRYR
jgi:hypothetical protein